MKNFALIGASGYIAPRHLKAIKDTNNNLLAALDRFDSVGIMDSYFPNADFFVEPERFDRHIEKLKYDKNIELDYVSICTPNYLHDSHIRMALRRGADAICEKPLVLNPWNLDALAKMEKESGQRVWNILQLRLHESIIELKKKVDTAPKNKIFDIDLTYLTSRGNWYYTSWKGDVSKSGTGRREAAITGWSWRAIGCHPVAELRVGTDKLAALTLGVIPLINPLSIDK